MRQATTINDADALLLYRVGPVFCCSPTMPVMSVQLPPRLNHLPGGDSSEPGVFRSNDGMVRVVDLRIRFGVEPGSHTQPGRIVVVEVENGLAGFWVDEIIDVVRFPETGWGALPALVPRHVFSRTLMYNDHLQLYADFENLDAIRETGYLRQHIQHLETAVQKESEHPDAPAAPTESEGFKHSSAETPHEHRPGSDEPATTPSPSIPERATETGPESSHRQPAADRLSKSPPDVDHVLMDRLSPDSAPAGPIHRIDGTRPSQHRAADQKDHERIEVPAQRRHTSPALEQPARMPASYPESETRSGSRHVSKQSLTGGLVLSLFALMAILLGGGYAVYLQFVGDISRDARIDTRVPVSTGRAVESRPADDKQIGLSDEPARAHETPGPGELTQNSVKPADRPAGAAVNGQVDIEPDEQQASPDYYANIDLDDHGLVIILTQPDDAEEPLLPEVGTPDTDSPAKASGTRSSAGSMDQTDVPGVREQAARVQASTTPKQDMIVHTVVRGDTLWDIARRYIHDPYRYPELARLSRIPNPDLIYPGDRVKIIVRRE